MALVRHKPDTPGRIDHIEKPVVADPKKHELYDHKNTPLWSLDAFLAGSPWTVEWYSQRLGPADIPKKLDIGSDPAYQSYDKIERMELLVQSAISPSYRDKEGLMQVTGSALVWSFVIPNVDNYFISRTNLARLGLFRVTNVNRRQHERESVYIIEYELEQEITEDHELYKDLTRKVVNTFVFSKQRLIENKNPILRKETYAKVTNMHFAYLDIAQAYFRDFFSIQSMSLQVPGQIGRHIDPLVLQFLGEIISLQDVPEMSRMRYASVNNEEVYRKPHLWNILYHRRIADLPYALKKVGKINPKDTRTPYFATSQAFIAADYVIRPYDPDDSTFSVNHEDHLCDRGPFTLPLKFKDTTNALGGTLDPETITYLELPSPIVAYHPVGSEDHYVFSRGFYEGSPQSLLEIMVMDYLRFETISLDQLSFMVNLYPKMERLAQFYYGPILLLLLKEAQRGAYA